MAIQWNDVRANFNDANVSAVSPDCDISITKVSLSKKLV